MEIKFTVPGSPMGNVTLHPYCTRRKCELVAVLPALKNGRKLPAWAPRRPRVCRINWRSVAYTPRQTIEYENLIRARYVAAQANLRTKSCQERNFDSRVENRRWV